MVEADRGGRVMVRLTAGDPYVVPGVEKAAYVPHPWTVCEYENNDGLMCQEQVVFGIQELGGKGEGAQACEAHVGFMLDTENWRGSAWRVWTL